MSLTATRAFRFTHRELDADGSVRLGYALGELELQETFALPAPRVRTEAVEPLLDLLHWIAGVSYYKAAIPERIEFGATLPGPATVALLEALYSEGLGEFAVVNALDALPRPSFAGPGATSSTAASEPRSGSLAGGAPLPPGSPATPRARTPTRVLVPVGGGKDSAVAIEAVRASGTPLALFSVGDATPIRETARVAALPRQLVTRTLDPALIELNAKGALNGHVPVTAIISAVALLTAVTQGFDAVALANERSASAANLRWHGVEVNHQFSKSRRAERLMADAVAEIPGAPAIFSILRPASELMIARAFAGLTAYHPVFTSCNRVFRIDPARRAGSWCCDCDKCRFVYLILAPFMRPRQLRAIFGADLLDDGRQYDGFARLAASGGDKPFECVGEVTESVTAMRMLAADPEWSRHVVVRRLAAELLPTRAPADDADLVAQLALSDDHDVPDSLIGSLREVLGA